MHQTRFWKKAMTLLTAAACAVTVAANASADIGAEKWQKIFNTTGTSWHFGAFEAVDFLDSNTILATGHDDGALAVRYDAATGTVLDSPPEWIQYDTGSDYFFDQVTDTDENIYFAGRTYPDESTVWKYDSTGALQAGWPKIYPATGDGRDTGVAIDSTGFVYGVGYSNSDWHISKYDTSTGDSAAGFPLTYDNGFNDKASHIAIDSNDNFIVAGWIGTSATSYDWHVRKYQSDGTLLWQTSYDLNGNTEAAIDVKVDSADNIIVCGYRNNGTDESTGMDRDWYIVKYARDGDGSGGATVLWEQAWNSGNGATSRVARTLLIDSSDNVYVAGDENDSSGAARPLIQYRDGATGNLLKIQRLSHPVTVRGAAGTAGTEHDYIGGLALDGNQLVIAGLVWEGYLNYGRTGFIIMLELTPDVGTEEWSSTFNSPNYSYNGIFYGANFLDDTKVLIGGGESSGIGIGIRYDTDTGNPKDTPPEWIKEPGDTFTTQTIGFSGNIYSSGRTTPVYKYTSGGTPVSGWPVTPGLTTNFDIAEDHAGNVYVVGKFLDDWQIYKYSSDGTAIGGSFPLTYDHAGLVDYVYRIAVDSDDNFIVVGIITQTGGNIDWLVRKYSSDGSTVLWDKTVDGNGNEDHPGHIIVDEDDNVLVCGRTSDGTTHNGYIVKYAKDDGSILWENGWNSGRGDIADRMVPDAKGNFYLAIRYENENGNWRYGIQYRNGRTGELLKSQRITHPVTYHNSPTTESNIGGPYVALNGGRLVIAGFTIDSVNTSYQYTGLVTLLDVEKTYNVTTAVDTDCTDGTCDLQAALDAAENNVGLNTVLHLQQGTYTGNFVYAPATGNNGDLTILGGWSADFSTRTVDPTNTILDGGNSGPVLQLNPGIAAGTTAVNGSLFVEGITVQHGSATAAFGGIGGGIMALTNSPGSIDITRTIITDNLATETGGGCAMAVTDFATPTGGSIYFSDNIVKNNTVLQAGETDGNGGGCSFIVSGETIVTNNLVYANSVGDTSTYTTPDGGGFDFDLMAGEVLLTNNTIVDNEVFSNGGTASGGGISLGTDSAAWGATTVELYNNIIYNNTVSTHLGEDIHNRVISETGGLTDGSTLYIGYCDYSGYLESTDPGTVTPTEEANTTADPALSDNVDSLYKLISGSPCIDTGSNTAQDMPGSDLEGNSRPQDNDANGTPTANMGCFEDIVYSIDANVGEKGSLDNSTPSPQIVYAGDTVSFTFNADAHYHVVSISNCGINYTNTDNSVTSYTVTTSPMTANCTVVATFAINTYTVNSSVSGGNGTISPAGDQAVNHGAQPTFTLTPDTHYHVDAVTGTCGGTLTGSTFTTNAVTADCTVIVNFAIDTFELEYSVPPDIPGTISGDWFQEVDYGSNGTPVTAVPNTGYHFVAWSDGSTANPRTDTNVTANIHVFASFATGGYTLTYTAGAHGSVSGTTPQTIDHGSDGSMVEAIPDTNYHFVEWSDGATANPRTDSNVMTDITVTANFAIDTHTLNLVFDGKGSGIITSTPTGIDCTTDCSADFDWNTEVTLTAVADDKSTFLGWSGDLSGTCTGTDTCTVTMDQAREITATFTGGFPWPMFLPAITQGNL